MKTKLVAGIGIYEKGLYKSTIDKKVTHEYRMWSSMIHRCLPGGIQQQRRPAYIGCSVHPDFIQFQDFAAWCHKQIGFDQKWELDKDILIHGNRVYGPDTCCFVPHSLNKLLIHNQNNGSKYPVGVSFNRAMSKFVSNISINNKDTYLGRFDTPEEASNAYQLAKKNEILRQAALYQSQIDPRVYQALIQYQV